MVDEGTEGAEKLLGDNCDISPSPFCSALGVDKFNLDIALRI
uniref:Uncharacterized protein n=1 Tax=Desertifilum tharense IPPAS B-1220 TaxID=1781255 RepID=A0ACD5GXC3_9CYAN